MNQTVHSYTTDTPENISNKFTYTLCRQFNGEAKNPKKSLGYQMSDCERFFWIFLF